ncbi:MAG: IPT/TIG domain-containing protein, partial [Myxococcaceae bacterium]|nr:IPT/TIG domain-containing protein [Myxococcaceae bacterium]
MPRLPLTVLLLVAATSAAQVGTCTTQTCGQFVASGSAPPACAANPASCRTAQGCFCDVACASFGDCCNQVEAVCNGPELSRVTPAVAPTVGGVALTLAGARFGTTAGAVTVDGVACPVAMWSNATVVCTAPPGVGTGRPIVVTTAAGRASNPVSLSREAPRITGVTPASVSTAGQVITLAGANFGAQGAVAVSDGGVALPPPGQTSHTQLVVAAPAGDADFPVQVAVGGQLSESALVRRQAPAIAGITPSALPANGAVITISGSSLGLAPAVTVGGLACPLVQVTPHTQVQCSAPAGTGAAVVRVAVQGRVGLGTVTYPGTSLTGVAPQRLPTMGGRLTFTGTGLSTPNLSVTIGGSPCVIAGAPTASTLQCDAPAGVGTDLPVRVSTGPTSSQTQLLVSYEAPVVTGLTPTSGPTAGGVTLTITGVNFGTAPTATIDGVACPLAALPTQTRVVCSLPPGAGAGVAVRVVAGGQLSNVASFDYAPPQVTMLTPATLPTAGALLTLSGFNFGAAEASVTVDGAPCPLVMATHTQLVCSAPPGPGGPATARVTVKGQVGDRAVQWSPPSLATVSPAAAPTRGGTVITLSGANFGTGSRTEVMVGAQACPLVTVGHATLTCVVPAAVTPGSSPVVVTVGLQATAPGAFSYAAPSISGVSPLRVPTAGGTTLTVIGASFGSASAGVTLAGQACPVLQQGHGAVLCRAPAGQGANLPLVVVSGGQASPAYFVSYEAPLVASTWPPRLPTTQTTLWIRGRDFGTSPAVTLGGVACPVLRSTGTEVVCAAPPGSPAAVPLVVVAAGQVSQTVLVTRTATCGRELSNGAVCEDHRECRGVGTCLGADCVGAPAASEGLACEDEDPCSSPGTCRSGVCLSPTGLDGGEACVTGSVCSGLGACLAGRCNAVPLNEDAGCTDYDGTTAGDVCRLGRCVGTPSAGDGGLPDGGGSADGGSGGGAAGGAAGGIAGGIAGGAAGGIAGGAAGGIAGGTAGGVAGGTAGGVAGGTAGGIAGGAAGGVAGGTAGGVAGG